MTKRSAVGQGSEPIECLTEIVENVLGRLDPDAEPDQIGWHLEFGPGGGRGSSRRDARSGTRPHRAIRRVRTPASWW